MTIKEIQGLIDSGKREDFQKFFLQLIQSNRNSLINMHRDYYDGKHWLISGEDRTNMTRSHKQIWGKKSSSYVDPSDKLGRRKVSSQDVAFHSGQLQTKNYIGLFIHTYQDFIAGSEDDDITVTFGDNPEINKELKKLWSDLPEIMKEQVARMVTDTVAITSLQYDPEYGYQIEIEDALEIFPIYQNKTRVGTVKAYTISKNEALSYGVNCEDDTVPFAKIYVRDNQQYLCYIYVDGILINEDGTSSPTILPPEMNFDPFNIVANIDDAYKRFDEKNLEESEIFGWIEKNDNLNANETIEFIVNLFLAQPKVKLNFDAIKQLNISISDPAFQQALQNFQFSPGSIDSLPIEIEAGQGIQESFYKGLDKTREALFEDAGLPKFILSGEGMSNVKAETLKLGMAMLERKINQKRQQLKKLIQMDTAKYLKIRGYVSPETTYKDLNIEIKLPSITSMSIEDIIQYLLEAVDKGVLPEQYVTQELLSSIGKGDDIKAVTSIQNDNSNSIRQEVDKQRALIRSEQLAKQQVEKTSQDKQKLSEIENRINSLK